MNTQVFDALSGQSAQMMGPARDLSKLAIAKLEQLISLQFASLRDYSELNLSQLKAAAEISSPKDLEAFLAVQQEFMKTVSEKMAGDAQAMAAISKDFAEEFQKIAFGGMAVMPQMPQLPGMSMMPMGFGKS